MYKLNIFLYIYNNFPFKPHAEFFTILSTLHFVLISKVIKTNLHRVLKLKLNACFHFFFFLSPSYYLEASVRKTMRLFFPYLFSLFCEGTRSEVMNEWGGKAEEKKKLENNYRRDKEWQSHLLK